MADPVIFISYSHKDEAEKDTLVSHLRVLQHAGLIGVWSDSCIGAGEDWQKKVGQAIDHAKIAVLLVTANFLNSEFILNSEVPQLLRRRQNEEVIIIPVIARACAWRAVKWLQQITVRPKDGTPVWSQGGLLVDEHLSQIAEEILLLLQKQNTTPFLAQPQQTNNFASVDKAKTGPRRILIVEDEPSWQRRLSRILRQIDCLVVTVGDYEQAENLLSTDFSFDLVTIDLNLDKSTCYADGLELALKIREQFQQQLPIIIITGTGNLDEQRRAFKEVGVFDFIQKARLDLEEFQEVVVEATRKIGIR